MDLTIKHAEGERVPRVYGWTVRPAHNRQEFDKNRIGDTTSGSSEAPITQSLLKARPPPPPRNSSSPFYLAQLQISPLRLPIHLLPIHLPPSSPPYQTILQLRSARCCQCNATRKRF